MLNPEGLDFVQRCAVDVATMTDQLLALADDADGSDDDPGAAALRTAHQTAARLWRQLLDIGKLAVGRVTDPNGGEWTFYRRPDGAWQINSVEVPTWGFRMTKRDLRYTTSVEMRAVADAIGIAR